MSSTVYSKTKEQHYADLKEQNNKDKLFLGGCANAKYKSIARDIYNNNLIFSKLDISNKVQYNDLYESALRTVSDMEKYNEYSKRKNQLMGFVSDGLLAIIVYNRNNNNITAYEEGNDEEEDEEIPPPPTEEYILPPSEEYILPPPLPTTPPPALPAEEYILPPPLPTTPPPALPKLSPPTKQTTQIPAIPFKECNKFCICNEVIANNRKFKNIKEQYCNIEDSDEYSQMINEAKELANKYEEQENGYKEKISSLNWVLFNYFKTTCKYDTDDRQYYFNSDINLNPYIINRTRYIKNMFGSGGYEGYDTMCKAADREKIISSLEIIQLRKIIESGKIAGLDRFVAEKLQDVIGDRDSGKIFKLCKFPFCLKDY